MANLARIANIAKIPRGFTKPRAPAIARQSHSANAGNLGNLGNFGNIYILYFPMSSGSRLSSHFWRRSESPFSGARSTVLA
jgi:hypothetical protein